MHSAILVLGIVFLSLHVGGSQDTEIDWKKIDWKKEIEKVLLPPSSFPQLPVGIRKELEKLGCKIPQPSFPKEPHNVIQGEFARPGQKDWAVLCSKEGISTIVVFWEESTACSDKISPAKDRSYFQGMGNGSIGYSRAIRAVGEKYISDHYERYGGTKPPPVDHQGIDDAFVGKASGVRYCHQGKWLILTGAD